jgi:ankyrin repeat protein
MLLAADNMVDCIEYLADSDSSGSGTIASIDAQDIHGDSALIKAARRGHELSVSCLIKLRADVNLTDEDNSSALFEAAREVDIFGVCSTSNKCLLCSDVLCSMP